MLESSSLLMDLKLRSIQQAGQSPHTEFTVHIPIGRSAIPLCLGMEGLRLHRHKAKLGRCLP